MGRTVVVHEIGDSDAKQRALHARIQAGNAFTVDDALGSSDSAGLRFLLLHLGAGGEGDEGVSVPHTSFSVDARAGSRPRSARVKGDARQGHGQQAASSASDGVGHVVALLLHDLLRLLLRLRVVRHDCGGWGRIRGRRMFRDSPTTAPLWYAKAKEVVTSAVRVCLSTDVE